MSRGMPPNGGDRVSPGEFYDLYVLPVLYDRLDQLFPEFGFKSIRGGWEATIAPDGFSCSPHRIACMKRAPYYISVVDSDTDGMTWIQYINGGLRMPTGKDFVAVVRKAAQIAGVDDSRLDGRELTPDQLKRIEQDLIERKKQAAAHQLQLDKQRMQDDIKAIESAKQLVAKAGEREDKSAAERYFKRRGFPIEKLGGKLPSTLLYTHDVGFHREMIGAVVCPVFTLQKGIVGCQRIFIESSGEPIEYKVFSNKDAVRKAALGRCVGGACPIGEPKPGDPLIICEGVETAVAIHSVTGCCVLACISALGMEKVELELIKSHLNTTRSVVIVAGDLDRSERGQRAMSFAADRIRFGLKVPVAESIPSFREFPALIDSNEMPIEGKSVDWEDAIKHWRDLYHDRDLSIITADTDKATLELNNPADFEEAVDDDVVEDEQVDEGRELLDDGEEVAVKTEAKDNRKFKPYAPVLPKQQLDAAHEYLLAMHGRETIEREGDGLKIVCYSERIHLWSDGCYTEIEGKPLEALRGSVRRYFRKHCKAKATKESPPRIHYVDADLSKSEVDSITAAVIDEIRVLLPTNDFKARYWLNPNVEQGPFGPEVIEDDMAWSRVVSDHHAANLPPADQIIPMREGIFDVQAWRSNSTLSLMPPTPLLFNLGRIEASIPLANANEAFKDGMLASLEEFAWELCPEWREFLERTFAHRDEECAPTVIRELHKWLGNLLAGDMGYHSGNIAWFVGPPGTGKSVLFKVVEALLGSNNIVSSTMSNLDSQFHLKSWIGKMLALFPDMDIGRVDKKKLVELLKLISTGDPVAVDRKYLDEIPGVRLGTRMAIGANQMPGIPDPTLSLVRRSIAFELRHTVKLVDQDPRLAERLTSPQSLAGIMLLSLIGIKDLDADQGFKQPKWYKGLIDDLKAQSSEYAELIDTYIEIEHEIPEDEWVSQHDLYKLFKAVCEANGQTHYPRLPSVISQLKVCLTGHGWPRFEPTRRDDQLGYCGIRINERGLKLIREPEGAGAGGHDKFEPPA